jgi:capsular exopolysaccharide synthesis family protein
LQLLERADIHPAENNESMVDTAPETGPTLTIPDGLPKRLEPTQDLSIERGTAGAEVYPEELPSRSSLRPVTAARIVSLHISKAMPLFPFDGTDSNSSEQYRILRTNMLHHPLQPKMIVVSSAGSGDGKTVTASNIAGILALRSDAQVLVVDGDLRRRSLAPIFGIPEGVGLTDVLRGNVKLEDALVRVAELPNLYVLPAGTPTMNPTELLDSAFWKDTAMEFRERFESIVIDSPPVATVVDFDLLQMVADGVVMVVRPDHTNRIAWQKAMGSIARDKLMGVVVNAISDWFLWRSPKTYYAAAPSCPS